MTGLDTNILVRYVTRDDEAQFRTVLKLLMRKRAVFFVCDQVLAELDWVLSSLYEWSRDEIADVLAQLLTVHNLVFEDEGRIRSSLAAVRRGADLADELITRRCHDQNCDDFATFDHGIVKRHAKFAFVPSQ